MDGEAAFLSVPSSNRIELNQFTSISVCIFIIIPSNSSQKECSDHLVEEGLHQVFVPEYLCK